MDDAELNAYFAEERKSIQFLYSKAFVDYENIESPVNSIMVGA